LKIRTNKRTLDYTSNFSWTHCFYSSVSNGFIYMVSSASVQDHNQVLKHKKAYFKRIADMNLQILK
jgi:hypothetical protein